ncbi:hypothetical protein EJ06DRAFT_526728 [Trichodelitschia bisporula]|uniref:Derlin n=1 Tax=Trichodelitschia bisporula TaxID=703511 RepID=A0A6G1I8M2_9PEZI|nr:hypothetical protein EJ06DRAFT_526728 [Trichodelitschia bisporula]
MSSPGLGLIMDPYLLYSYSSVLERDSPRFTELGSYFVYLTFVSTVIVALCGYYLEGYVFLQPLILAFAYTFSQENPNANVTMWFLTFPAKFLPLALLFLTFVMAGPGPAKQQLTGLIAAHLYDFLIRIWPMFGGGRNVLATPMFVKRWFGANRGEQRRAYGTAVFAREQVPRSEPQFGQRGPGRRLGD